MQLAPWSARRPFVLLLVLLVAIASCSSDEDLREGGAGETINLDVLLDSPSDIEPPEIVALRIADGYRQLQPGGTFEVVELDREAVRYVGTPNQGVLAFVVPYLDRTGLCLFEAEADNSGVGLGCTSAENFNAAGIWLATGGADGHTTVVVPEGTEIGDVRDARVHPSGLALTIDGVYTDISIEDGRIDL